MWGTYSCRFNKYVKIKPKYNMTSKINFGNISAEKIINFGFVDTYTYKLQGKIKVVNILKNDVYF